MRTALDTLSSSCQQKRSKRKRRETALYAPNRRFLPFAKPRMTSNKSSFSRSGQCFDRKKNSVYAHCQSRKLLKRTSPEVRSRMSGGGLLPVKSLDSKRSSVISSTASSPLRHSAAKDRHAPTISPLLP